MTNQAVTVRVGSMRETIISERYAMLEADVGDDHVAILIDRLDPVTIELLWKLGAQILASVGAKAIEGLLKSINTAELEDLFRQFFGLIVDAIKGIIIENEIQRSVNSIQGSLLELSEYNTAPATSMRQLEDARHVSAQAVTTLASYLPKSLFAYVFASLSRISILQELALVTKSPEEAIKVQGFAKLCAEQVRRSLDLLARQNDLRVSTISTRHVYPNHLQGDLIDPHYVATYTLNGAKREFSDESEGGAIAKAHGGQQRDLSAIRKDFQIRIALPVGRSLQDLDGISNWKLP